MRRYLSAVLVASVTAFQSSAAIAGTEFGYVYTAETEEKGETELSLWATDRRGKAGGHYDAQDYRFEVERGLTDRFQMAAYANFVGHHARGLDGEVDRVDRDLTLQGFSAELIYQLADPAKKSLGVAFYAEPGWSRISKVTGERTREYELELKAIIQKNFLSNRLIWAMNLTFEPEWEHEHEEILPAFFRDKTEKELAIAVSTGLSYRAARKLWLGVEARYHSVYPNWMHGLHRENYAVSAGPSLHYDGGEWSVTATWLPQLFGAPNERGLALELDDHEKRELRLKISREF